MWARVIDKCLSGRFILTLIAGIVFLYCAVTGKIEAAAMTAILTSIFQSYFSRTDRGNGKSTDKT